MTGHLAADSGVIRTRRSNALLANALLALVYALLGLATLALGEVSGLELRRVIWVSSGIAVSAGLLLGFPVWAGAGLGGAIATFVAGGATIHVLGTGLANGAEVALAVTLLRRARFDAALPRVRDVLLLIGGASGIAAATGTLLSVISLHAAGGVPEGAWVRIYLLWWLTHAMGILVVVPTVLSLALRRGTLARRHPLEVVVVLGAVAFLTALPFSADEQGVTARLFFLPFPLLLWAAIRLGVAGASLGGLIATSIAMTAAVWHRGPLAFGTATQTLFLTWVFSNVVVTATLISAALVEEMEAAHAAQRAGEGRLRAVLDATTEAIVVTDAAGTVTHVNRAAAAIWPDGVPDPELGQPIERIIEPLERRIETAETSRLRAAAASDAEERGTLTFADGRIWQWEVDSLSVAGERGGRVWSFDDITEQARSEAERRSLEAQLLHIQKLESLGVLAGGIAHDFNNLLMSIRGHAELIEMTAHADATVREDVAAILTTADAAASLCRQMLAYAGRGTIEVRTLDLSAVTREIHDMLRVSVSRQVAFRLELCREATPVQGDVAQIRQVLINLVTNASDAVEATGHSGEVRVRTRRARLDGDWLPRLVVGKPDRGVDYAILEVSDDGIGMSAEAAGRIFDPFFSSKGVGRGLGLASALGVIRSHGALLALTTGAGTGSTFGVAFPISKTPATDGGRSPQDRRAARFDGRRILVVDDEPGVRAVLSRMLVAMGFTVREASDGDEALVLLDDPTAPPPDAIILDLTMPRRDGRATLAAMRARGLSIPVILASGFSSEAVEQSPPVAAFVQKPFRRGSLETVLLDALGD